MTFKPQKGWIPAWMDAATLAANISVSVDTIPNWVAAGILPPGRQRGGKLMWKWSEVDAMLTDGPAEKGSVTDAVRREREADRRHVGH